MGTINRGVIWVDGQYLTAADLNGEFNIIHDEFNGNIDDANIKAAAAIAGTKIAPDFGQQAVTLQELAVDPSTLSNKGRLYTKDVTGGTELFYRDAAGNVVQITSGGNLIGGITTLPGYIYDCSISPNSVSPTSKIDIATGGLEIDVSAANNPEILEVTSTIVIDMTVEGKNGFEASPTTLAVGWYFPYVVYNPSTQKVAGVMSASTSTPTLTHASLSGFTKFRRVGSIYNTASGSASIRSFHQTGMGPSRFYIFAAVNVANNVGTASSWTSISLTSAIPPTADEVQGIGGANQSNAASRMVVAGGSNGEGKWHLLVGDSGSTTIEGFGGGAVGFRVPIKTSQAIYYKSVNAASFGRFDISGYGENI